MPQGLEIERKYLIAMPDVDFLLKKGAVKKEITQTYLSAPEGVSERVRKTVVDGRIIFTHTLKTKIEGIIRTEEEKVVTKEEYDSLLLRADPTCLNIKKERYVLSDGRFTYEFDVFPFWQEKAFVEVELESAEEKVVMPPYVTVLADVSEDKRYTNHALARALKKENL